MTTTLGQQGKGIFIMTDLLLQFVRILFPRSFIAFKVRLYSLLLLGLVVDFGLRLRLRPLSNNAEPGLSLELSGPDLAVIIVCAITLIFLVLVNWILRIRHQQLRMESIELAKQPGIPNGLKRDVIREVLRESQRIF